MRTIALDRTVLAYDDVGPDHGAPLLLVHGHPFDRSMWAPQLRRFGGERRVLVPDLRGYGASRGAVAEWAAFADDLAALLDGLRVPRVVVAGLSMGGQIALELWARHPHRVAGLLLADTTAAGETAVSRAARRDQAARLLREGMDPYAVDALYLMVSPDAPPAVASHVLEMMRAADPAGAAAAQRARADRPDRRPDLAGITVPTVVVVGGEDTYTPVADARRIADGVPGAELVVVDGAAHLPNLERPDAFDAAVARLLDRVDAP
ncbi:alpha/beta fold hydrolase [Pseudonocardia kunmingensis]|uniref:Pimeloyl-ACP methyl ester carboxylesterase n=1 Tax=Pseudonocardia kunmingensis TaxID=630975 RepID=A0A543D9Z5_9PSEU|nr:alpha/beta fold hydrolase [Pseudonocardia kunmingensis]TQM06163.1 pimeloyl-ACP methyl ester carboxylesterase [Pseudonocardia kunmingensis]